MKQQLLLFVLMLLPIVASEDDSGKCGDNVNYTYVEATHTLTISGSGEMKNYSFGSTPWNSYKTSIKTINIESGVTSIGDFAFNECSGLTSVTIPNSVTSIGYWAFGSCSGLTSVTIPNSVISIGNCAFYYCSGLISVTIPNSVTSIANGVFRGCSGLSQVLVEIGNPKYDSRNYCNAIIETATNTLIWGCKNTIIPNSVTSIEQSAFEGCSGLSSVTIPNSVTSIGEGAFCLCSGLTSVTIGNSVTRIEPRAFEDCYALNSVHISDIAAWCKMSCSNYFSNPLEYAHHLYLGDEEIKDLVIPNNVTSIGDAAFMCCSGLTSVTIPNSVTSIGYSSFSFCTSLTSVTIPNSVTSIGCYAFDGCSSLTSVTIPNNLKSMEMGVFRSCSGLTSVTIPNSVTSIGYEAFAFCSGLTSITIPNNVTSIGDAAFWGCSVLTSVTIPNSMTSIGGSAFQSCINLKIVQCFAEDVPSTSSTAFGASNPQNATLFVPGVSLNDYKTTVPWSYFGTIKPIDEGAGIGLLDNNIPMIQSQGGVLTIQGADDGTKIGVYNINGTLAGEGISRFGCATVNTNLQPGSVAIIKIGDRNVKVVVK